MKKPKTKPIKYETIKKNGTLSSFIKEKVDMSEMEHFWAHSKIFDFGWDQRGFQANMGAGYEED